MKINTVTIEGERIDVSVDAGGHFSATFNEEDYTASSLRELTDKLIKAVRQSKQEHPIPISIVGLVPVTEKSWRGYGDRFERGIGVVHAVLRGRNTHTRNWMLSTDDGTKPAVRFQSSYHWVCTRRLTPTEVEQYLTLATAAKQAADARDAFATSVAIDVDASLTQGKPVRP